MAISALVLAGLPVTSTLTSSAAWSLSASPCGLKIAPLASSRSPRSMPLVRGRAPTRQRQVDPVEDALGSSPISTVGQQRERAVVQLHHHALQRLERWGDLEQPQLDRLVGAQHRAAGDPEQQAVADLAGGAGDGDLDGCAHGNSLEQMWAGGS